MRHTSPFCLSLLALVLLTACATPRQMALFATSDASEYALPEPQQALIEPYDRLLIRLSALDQVAITPYRELGTEFYVASDGNVLLPIIGAVPVAGLTEQQAADAIAARLATGVVNPVVQLTDQSLIVTILGEVGTPGRYGLRSALTLPDLLGLAGGLTPNARRDDVLILRREGDKIVHYHVSLADNSLFASPCYWLRRDDVVILSPRRSRPIH